MTALRVWFLRHLQTALGALGTVTRNPVASTLTIGVIGIALALPAALNLLVQQGRLLAGDVDATRDFSVYLLPGTAEARARELADGIRDRAGIASVRLITADQALARLRSEPGFAEAVDRLASNPLPHTLVVRPAAEVTRSKVEQLADDLTDLKEVDQVRVDSGWIERLTAILGFVRRMVLVAAVLLGCTVLFVVGNTIRLDIRSRAQEIEVAKLLGATDAFVRRPFLYLGFWYGLAGGLLALLLLGLTLLALRGPARELLALYGGATAFVGVDGGTAAGVLLGGIIAGWAGAWIAVGRHIADIEPQV
jgi:cell division transport system permease protein